MFEIFKPSNISLMRVLESCVSQTDRVQTDRDQTGQQGHAEAVMGLQRPAGVS